MLHDLHADAWRVPALRVLSLHGCRRASGAQLLGVLAGLPELRCLDLPGRWNVSGLQPTGGPVDLLY